MKMTEEKPQISKWKIFEDHELNDNERKLLEALNIIVKAIRIEYKYFDIFFPYNKKASIVSIDKLKKTGATALFDKKFMTSFDGCKEGTIGITTKSIISMITNTLCNDKTLAANVHTETGVILYWTFVSFGGDD